MHELYANSYAGSHIETHSDSRKDDDYHSNRRCSSSRAVLLSPVRVRWIRCSEIGHTFIPWNDTHDRVNKGNCINDRQSYSLKIQKVRGLLIGKSVETDTRDLPAFQIGGPDWISQEWGSLPHIERQQHCEKCDSVSNVIHCNEGFAPRSRVWFSTSFPAVSIKNFNLTFILNMIYLL